MKRCQSCKTLKMVSAFKVDHVRGGYYPVCKKCSLWRKQRSRHRGFTVLRYGQVQHKELVFNHYCKGDVRCIRCGFRDVRALSIDHVNDDGAEHRRTDPTALRIYVWLVKHKYPDGFQVLCMNCQWIKLHEMRKSGNV